MRFFHVIAAFCALAAGPVRAEGPAFDCSKAESSAEEAVCASDDLTALDRELARLYGLAVNGPNMSEDRLKELRAYQRGWVKGRDECWKANQLETCIADEYALRIHDLRQGYADARAEEGASLGPFPYACEGLDALVSVAFVNTGPSRAVLKWRENALVLTQAESGSGARYEAGDAEFWTKGDEAMFTAPDGGSYSCAKDDMG
ncbi:MliC family protein [Seohaeicola saemankumensis]|nr:MliC family protein [Seohaeicola saemankumensis]MCA0870843.1 MliC family protein [Seohaeicola saemankumensis]